MKRAILIPVDGDPVDLELPEGDSAEYEAIKEAIGGGYLQMLPTRSPNVTLWFDEEGKLKGLPGNYLASEAFKECLMFGDFFVGPVVVTGADYSTGDTTTLDGTFEEVVVQATT
jgi:hypothetical protein